LDWFAPWKDVTTAIRFCALVVDRDSICELNKTEIRKTARASPFVALADIRGTRSRSNGAFVDVNLYTCGIGSEEVKTSRETAAFFVGDVKAAYNWAGGQAALG
jgi:hypothetical protein